MMDQQTRSILEDILAVGRRLYERGMINAYEGNVSARIGDVVYITPTSTCKENLTVEMLAGLRLSDGVQVVGKKKASSEAKLHLAAYRLRADVMGVVHDHSPYCTAYSINGMAIETLAYPEMTIAHNKIPVVPYGTPSTDAIHAGLGTFTPHYDLMLLGNHGLVALGTDVWDAYYKAEAAEAIAKTLHLARQLGPEDALPPEEIAVLRQMHIAKMKSEGKNTDGFCN